MTMTAEPTTTAATVRPGCNPAFSPEPAVGIHENVPFEVYAAWRGFNQSGAKRILRSGAHFKACADDESKTKARGTICHAGIWESARFDEMYAIGPDVKLNTKEGKAAWEAFCEASPGKFHVRGADGDAMLGIRKSIWAHRNARKLLGAPGPCELSIVWDDPELGVRCKARIDKHVPAASAVVDLKTTTDARPRAFQKSIGEYGYHLQSAFNLHGMAAVGLTCETFYLIAAETSDPYAVMVYEMDDKAVERGRELMLQAMAEYQKCKAEGVWPAYDETALRIVHPEWA